MCEKGEKRKSAPLLLNCSTWNNLGRCGQFLWLWNESLLAVCWRPSLWTQRRDVAHTPNKIKLAWFPRQDLLAKLRIPNPSSRIISTFSYYQISMSSSCLSVSPSFPQFYCMQDKKYDWKVISTQNLSPLSRQPDILSPMLTYYHI